MAENSAAGADKVDRRYGPRGTAKGASESEPAAESAEERIARLEAELAEKQKLIDVIVPTPADEVAQAAIAIATSKTGEGPGPKHTIHFLTDGFTALGKVWYRGEELTVAEGSPDWERLQTQYGNEMTLSQDVQRALYGQVHHKAGPWPHDEFDLTDENLSPNDKAALLQVAKRRAALQEAEEAARKVNPKVTTRTTH